MNQTGLALLGELKKDPNNFPLYNSKLVGDIERLIVSYQETINEIVQSQDTNEPEIASSLVFYHFSIQRNKRYLCLYHNERLNVLKNHCTSNHSTLAESLDKNCSDHEREFFKNYNQLIQHTIGSLKINLIQNDLIPPTNVPPKRVLNLLTKYNELLTNK
ncbi:partner of sld5 [Anaeramoeba flamelloides]|uniref:Partner of sld5 n=1 Tax=Anaeramoeba flamelloides TaxID=1746091 RepID=A0AAV7YEW0_9EUKA|nr:partner of sld5 [Anaeramoeba flamelloides]KAJ6242700.1 partner of sld5 [Anaeramoeba flamelloides]